MREKQELRDHITSILATLPETARSGKSSLIAHSLFTEPSWKNADIIFIFLSFGKEPATDMIVIRAFSENKLVAVPRITCNNIVFHRITGLEDNLLHSSYGIREPHPSLPTVSPEEADAPLVITPGLAFDRNKNRLGRGKGYYDRFFSSITNNRIVKTGICFHEQLVTSVPSGGNDRKVDIIITDREIIR